MFLCYYAWLVWCYIFSVIPVSDVIRIRTGERGERAERMAGGLADKLSSAMPISWESMFPVGTTTALPCWLVMMMIMPVWTPAAIIKLERNAPPVQGSRHLTLKMLLPETNSWTGFHYEQRWGKFMWILPEFDGWCAEVILDWAGLLGLMWPTSTRPKPRKC